MKETPIELQLLDKSLHQKLLFHPDLYFGEAYTNGSLRLKNGTLTEFLDIAFKNIGRADINIYGKTLNKIKGTLKYLTSFNKIVNLNKMLHTIMIFQKNYMICFLIKKDNIHVHTSKTRMILWKLLKKIKLTI